MLVDISKMHKSWRKLPSIFVVFFGPRKGAGTAKNNFANRIRVTIEEAYQAQSFTTARHYSVLATSWAEKTVASPVQLCKIATWTSFHTFALHYWDLLSSQDFGSKVLQEVIPP